MTGDLAHNGEPEACAALRKLLERLQVPYRLLIGNHDDRQALVQAFPETPVDDNGYLQSVLSTRAGVLMFLDTVDAAVHSGAYNARRCGWLERTLSDAAEQPVFLFLHHPPMAIGMPRLDQYRIQDNSSFRDVVMGFSTLRHIFLATYTVLYSAVGMGFPSRRCAAPTIRIPSISAGDAKISQVLSHPLTPSY